MLMSRGYASGKSVGPYSSLRPTSAAEWSNAVARDRHLRRCGSTVIDL